MRDFLLQTPCNDFDIEIHQCSVGKFETLMQKLGAKGVGKSFFVYKYDDIDISLPRTESKVAHGHRGFSVSLAKDLKQACMRRDFTFNALVYDMQENHIVDFFGGIKDIEQKVLKIVNTQTFMDDSLRVLRAMQFCARFGFKIESHSLKIMQNMDLSDLSDERIFKEFEKMFYAPKLHFGLYYMLKLCIAKKIFDKELNFRKFFKYSKLLNQKFNPKFYHYMFIYQLKSEFNFQKLQALPNNYTQCFKQPKLPKKITKRYLLAVAIHYKIADFLGNYNKKVIQYAKELDIYDKKFQALSNERVIALGYKGKKISQKIKEENLKAIRSVSCTKN